MNVDLKTLWDYRQPTKTREKFSALMEAVKNEADLNYVLELETQIARTHSLVSEFEKGHEILDGVEQRLNEETLIAHEKRKATRRSTS